MLLQKSVKTGANGLVVGQVRPRHPRFLANNLSVSGEFDQFGWSFSTDKKTILTIILVE